MLTTIVDIIFTVFAVATGALAVLFWFLAVVEDGDFFAPAQIWTALCVMFVVAGHFVI